MVVRGVDETAADGPHSLAYSSGEHFDWMQCHATYLSSTLGKDFNASVVASNEYLVHPILSKVRSDDCCV